MVFLICACIRNFRRDCSRPRLIWKTCEGAQWQTGLIPTVCKRKQLSSGVISRFNIIQYNGRALDALQAFLQNRRWKICQFPAAVLSQLPCWLLHEIQALETWESLRQMTSQWIQNTNVDTSSSCLVNKGLCGFPVCDNKVLFHLIKS